MNFDVNNGRNGNKACAMENTKSTKRHGLVVEGGGGGGDANGMLVEKRDEAEVGLL